MGFGWLGTFRQGQWQAYRKFVLNERRDVGRRMTVIQAELSRIGSVTVYYNRTTDPTSGESTVSEQRTGITVEPGSLQKLLQAYVAQGGNPFDISLFLTPDSTFILDPDDPETEMPTQPSGGVVYPKSGSYGIGVQSKGGFLSVKKYPPARTGGRKDLQDSTIAIAVDLSRRWVNQTLNERLHDLEARIIKLMDLREQLKKELEDLTMAVGGTSGAVPSLDTDFFSTDLGVAKIVASIDAIWYTTDEDGVPNFESQNNEALALHPSLMPDDPGDEEENTTL